MLLQPPRDLREPAPDDAGVEIEAAADWIEASVLFSNERATEPEVIDAIREKLIIEDRDKAERFVADVWRQLASRRHQCGDGSPFDADYQEIHLRSKSWREWPAYAFCLLLSYRPEGTPQRSEKSYNEQGTLFEQLTEAALAVLLPTWTVHRTGWSAKKPDLLPAIVEEVARRLCGDVGNLKRWQRKQTKELGLDLVCYREFGDRRGGFPTFLVQCASGRNFTDKLDEPNEGIWNDLLKVIPQSLPRRAFATPFSFPRREFENHSIQGKCWLLDRMRLLSASLHLRDWLPDKLGRELAKWCGQRTKLLPWLK
ncbi:MAG: hypothetical protein ABMA13_10800 [Chthoniobacteraceae bacterium]